MSKQTKRTRPRHRKKARAASASSLPGDLSPEAEIDRMLRVDQAGEFGAVQIYRGQLAVLRGTKSQAAIEDMAAAERDHLERFDKMLVERGVRPTALTPLWRAAGFMLGAGSALISERHAMACTVAVEEVIDAHYKRQAARLGPDEGDLKDTIDDFRRDEAAHRDAALAQEAERAPGYRPFTRAIKAGTRLAIFLSERI